MRVPISKAVTPDWGIPFDVASQPAEVPLQILPLPARVVVPLLQHTGAAATPLVSVGDQVYTGQPIGKVAEHTLGARVHASLSGRVTAIATGPVPGRRPALCVHIESDDRDTPWPEYKSLNRPLSLSTSALRHAVIEAGIVGLGGATFPAGLKLNRGSGVSTLILNAAECEPVISCDEALLIHDTAIMLTGAQVMLRILEADECIVAIKQGMTAAIDAVTAAIEQCNDDRFRIALVPSIYPVGGEAQLIQMLTGNEIPAGGLPWDSGAICHNVGTAAAVARFLTRGEPLISRIVTVTGSCVSKPVNVRARIGTPCNELISAAGGSADNAAAVIMGGPMMGVDLGSDDLPVTKATNCLYVASADDVADKPAAIACIRCGDCATACPANLMPQLLLQSMQTQDYEKVRTLGLPDCIECGACDYVCPSHIPLTREFVQAKQQLWQISFEKQRAEKAAQRFRAHQERSERDAQIDAVAGTERHDVSDVANAKSQLDDLLRRLDDAGDSDRKQDDKR